MRLFLLNASSARGIEVAFADLVAQRASAFLLKTDPFFMTERNQLVALAAPVSPTHIAWSADTPAAFPRVKGLLTCRSSKR